MELEGFQEVSGLLHCCVYALVWRREVVYVGQSRQPFARLASHANARGKNRAKPSGYNTVKIGVKFDQVFIRNCMLAELDSLELAMIAKYQPQHNIKGMPKAGAAHIDRLVADLLSTMPPPAPVAQPQLYRRF